VSANVRQKTFELALLVVFSHQSNFPFPCEERKPNTEVIEYLRTHPMCSTTENSILMMMIMAEAALDGGEKKS
jgi:hypothetical protein